MQRLCVVAVLLTLCASVGMCQQNEISQGFRKTSDATDLEAITKDINYESYSIFTLDQARDLLLHTLCSVEHCDPTAKDFYAIIHVLKWGNVQNNKQSLAGEHWYVYHPENQGWNQEQFTDDKRLFGAKSFYLLYVHLNIKATVPYTPLYQIQITRKIPQNIANVFALLQLGAGGRPLTAETNRWGGRKINVGQRPSDIKVDPRLIPDLSTPTNSNEISSAQTFNNEGKYWWDVSVAVPVKKISAVKFDSTNNTVTPAQTSTQNMFAVVDGYFKPVDLSQSSYSLLPHPIAGVALAQQPLHKILVGGAIGLYYAEVYVGALFVKQQSLTNLTTGSSATPEQVAAASHYSYEAQFTVGINLPVRSIVNSVKSKK